MNGDVVFNCKPGGKFVEEQIFSFNKDVFDCCNERLRDYSLAADKSRRVPSHGTEFFKRNLKQLA